MSVKTIDEACAVLIENTVDDLIVRCSRLSVEKCETFAKALEKNTALKHLDLSFNHVKSKGCAAIAKALKTNTALEFLDLSRNRIKSKGCMAIAKAFERNTALKGLDLSQNYIKNKGCAALSQLFEKNVTLEFLFAIDNHIDSEGCVAIAKTLQTNATLQVFVLNERCAPIAKAFETNTALDITYNIIDIEGYTAIEKMLEKNRHIKRFDAGFSPVIQNTIDEELETCEGCGTRFVYPENVVGLRGRRCFECWWSKARLVLSGRAKNGPECPFSWLPPEIARIVVGMLENPRTSNRRPQEAKEKRMK